MLDRVKTKALISLGSLAATSFILMMGYTAGQHATARQSQGEIEQAAQKLVQEKEKETKATVLSADAVQEFLTQYFTKEKLGENNKRIQPYMTESAYSQELTSQNDASSQVYKDYILDYHFDKADIFVDEESSQAIAEVSYQVTYVSDLKNTEQAKTKQTETRLVKLSYAKLSGNLLVNKMEIWKSGLEDYKGKSIVEVAQSLGIDLKRISSHLYEHPDHDSFRIFANTNTFKWFSRDIQGDVIDFVRVTQNVSFKEALHYLAGQEFKAQEVQEISDIPFSYPLYQMEDKSFRLARAYLKEKRCLSDETINFFGRQGVLAQANWITKGINEPVVVFKSLDHRGLIQGASLQGIHDSALHKRGQLKKILKGSHGHN